MQAVLDGRADLGIFADRTHTHGLHTMNYREDRLVLVVPSGHAPARRLHTEAQALGRQLRLRIRVRSFDAMCRPGPG